MVVPPCLPSCTKLLCTVLITPCTLPHLLTCPLPLPLPPSHPPCLSPPSVAQTFSVEIAHEETLVTGQVAYLQAALLYTNSVGERRIRVHTMAIPVVSGACVGVGGSVHGVSVLLVCCGPL